MIKEISYINSREYLSLFQAEEKSYGTDWYDCEDENATYIWWIDVTEVNEKPLGFLSYKILILPNKIDFVYIVKIYVLKSHRGENPILVEEERVSLILFREIERKGINILTLESACETLDDYYKSLGFEYNEDISNIFANEIGTREQIMYRKAEDINLSDEEKNMFGDII